MADYIDRQAAFAALDKFAEECRGSAKDGVAFAMAAMSKSVILNLPSPWVDAKAHPPEKNGEYLCCFGFTLPVVGLCKERFFGPISYYATDENPHWNSEGTHGLTVLSWMPMPDAPEE